MLNDALLDAFMHTFYGYGTYKAPYWFVGMEEGGGGSLAAAEGRINQWQLRGQPELEPLRESDETSESPWFRPNPRLQSTWKQLIRMMLVSQGQSPSITDLKAYQRDHLGRANGETCLLELLPLPSPSTRHWFYKSHTSIRYLQSRDLYRAHLAPIRAAHLKQLITQHTPKVVIFYSANWWYRRYWQQIAPAPFEPVTLTSGTILKATTPETTFIVTKHPVTMGITNRYFHEIGTLLQTSSK